MGMVKRVMDRNKKNNELKAEAINKAVDLLNIFKGSNHKITMWCNIRKDIEKEYPTLNSMEIMSIATDKIEE
jgi:hypothetical protein